MTAFDKSLALRIPLLPIWLEGGAQKRCIV